MSVRKLTFIRASPLGVGLLPESNVLRERIESDLERRLGSVVNVGGVQAEVLQESGIQNLQGSKVTCNEWRLAKAVLDREGPVEKPTTRILKPEPLRDV